MSLNTVTQVALKLEILKDLPRSNQFPRALANVKHKNILAMKTQKSAVKHSQKVFNQRTLKRNNRDQTKQITDYKQFSHNKE